jgi:hypothetical protein
LCWGCAFKQGHADYDKSLHRWAMASATGGGLQSDWIHLGNGHSDISANAAKVSFILLVSQHTTFQIH